MSTRGLGFRICSMWMVCSLVLIVGGCASSVERNLEEAEFLLDKQKYAEAAEKAEAALAEDPDNTRGKILLAMALMGQGILGEGRTYLGLLADLLEQQEPGESSLETFARISPSLDEEKFGQVEDATDILVSIPDGQKTKDEFLQQYLARVFEISTTLSRIGATSEDNECNADPDLGPDGVPDDLDPPALSTDRAARFRDNVDNANGDAEMAGLSSEFGLSGRFLDMSTALADAIVLAGDTRQGVIDFLEDEFGDTGGVDICPVP